MNTYRLNEKKNSGRYLIRPFTGSDIEQVSELFIHHFAENFRTDLQVIKKKLISDLSNPNRSMVCCSSCGTVHGYITVKLVDFVFKGKPVTGAICSDFMVNEQARNALVPMRMLQKVLRGPQDFSFTEDAAQASRLMWCRLGGQIAYPYSSYYTIILRPASFSTHKLTKNLPSWTNHFFDVLGRGMDKFFEKLHLPFYEIADNDLTVTELTGQLLEEKLNSLINSYGLYPLVSKRSLNDFIDHLREEKHFGDLRAVAIQDPEGNTAGWFIYYLNYRRRCNVIHAECTPGNENYLYASLKKHAFSNGGVNITGRLSPSQFGSSFSENTLSRPGCKWSLIHSKNPDLVNMIQSGKAFLTRCW